MAKALRAAVEDELRVRYTAPDVLQEKLRQCLQGGRGAWKAGRAIRPVCC